MGATTCWLLLVISKMLINPQKSAHNMRIAIQLSACILAVQKNPSTSTNGQVLTNISKKSNRLSQKCPILLPSDNADSIMIGWNGPPNSNNWKFSHITLHLQKNTNCLCICIIGTQVMIIIILLLKKEIGFPLVLFIHLLELRGSYRRYWNWISMWVLMGAVWRQRRI